MTRRMYGSGCIDRLPSGRYRVRLPASIDRTRRSLGVFPSEAEAQRHLAAALDVVQRDRLVSRDGVTLRAYAERWLDERERRGYVARSPRLYYRTHVARAPFVDSAMRAVSVADIRDWLARLPRTPVRGRDGVAHPRTLSLNTVRAIRSLLSGVFGEAEREGLIDANPVRRVRLRDVVPPRLLRADPPWTYLTAEEIERIAVAPISILPAPERLIVEVAIGTGLRVSEQWCLHLEDVIVTSPDPHVVVRYGCRRGGRLDPPKGGRVRTVPLFGLGLRAMREWLRGLPDFTRRNPKGLVFPTGVGTRGGEYRRMHGGPKGFRPAMAALGIRGALGPRVTWHSLRHTCASMLVSGEWGEPWTLQAVGELLGHADIHSAQRYAHLAETALKRAARATDRSWGSGHDRVISLASMRDRVVSRESCSPPRGG
jgi:integrase